MKFEDEIEFKNNMGIYAIINKNNGKLYIGQTRQPFKKRYLHHKWKLKNNSHDNIHLQNAFNLYGEENFEFKILKCLSNKDELNHFEIYFINKFKLKNLTYNIQEGGQSKRNYKFTDEHKSKIGKANKIRMTGKKLSEETKSKMSNSRKGNKYNIKKYIINEEIAKIIKLKLIQGFSCSEISENLNISYKIINAILSNDTWKQVSVDGWEDFKNNRIIKKRLSIEECIIIYNKYLEGNYSQVELANIFGKSRGTIINAIKRARNNI